MITIFCQIARDVSEARAGEPLLDAALECHGGKHDLLGVQLPEHVRKAYSQCARDTVGLSRFGPRGGRIDAERLRGLCYWRAPSASFKVEARWLNESKLQASSERV
jgi:hypothetical protein